ncbi:hypothetical protein CYJ10_15630 [Cupriavidus pauculus]|uniref:histidine kinase n=1 Tax=Cupriavidus pauculus TaxID=82633 RepID=A0A2N5CC37_9BURK|nr:hypothetical protein CYJ10_15630 [Cupriavidus pauculus]
MSGEARARLAPLRLGIERGRHLLEQLLSLARVQSAPASASATSVLQVIRRVIEDLMPLADTRGADIGVLTDDDVRLKVDGVELYTLIRNLLDNAVRYSPAGGAIDLSIATAGDEVVLSCIALAWLGARTIHRQRHRQPAPRGRHHRLHRFGCLLGHPDFRSLSSHPDVRPRQSLK